MQLLLQATHNLAGGDTRARRVAKLQNKAACWVPRGVTRLVGRLVGWLLFSPRELIDSGPLGQGNDCVWLR